MPSDSIRLAVRTAKIEEFNVKLCFLSKLNSDKRRQVMSSVGNGGTRTFLDFTHLSVVSVKI